MAFIGMLVTFYFLIGPFGYSKEIDYKSHILAVMYGISIIVFGLLIPLRRSTPKRRQINVS